MAGMWIAVWLEPPVEERPHIGRNLAADQVSDDRLKPRVTISNKDYELGLGKSRQKVTNDKLVGPSDVIIEIQPPIALDQIFA